MTALDVSYEEYIKINGGEFCGICGRPPPPNRRLDRDHDHASGNPRGLLCRRCNRQLTRYLTDDWLRHSLAYLLHSTVTKEMEALWECFLLSGADPSPYAHETRTEQGRLEGLEFFAKQRDAPEIAIEAVRQLREDCDVQDR